MESKAGDFVDSTDSDSSKRNSVTDQPASIYRLSSTDYTIICQSIGVLLDGGDGRVSHPRSFFYPPKGIPQGLYKDVIRSRVNSQYQYYAASFLFTLALILQLFLAAILTAIGSTSAGTKTRVTILAAVNTILAGFMALMHNSGLPDRYKNDWTEFDQVEMYIRELVDAGIVRKGWTRDQVVEHCFSLYRTAKGTVAKNKPAAYVSTTGPAARSSAHLARQN